MKHATQVALLQRVLRMCEERSLGAAAPETSLDALRYYAAERYEQERRRPQRIQTRRACGA